VYERGIVHEAVLVAGEKIARDRTAGGLVGLGADEHAEIGIQRHRALGQEALHRIGLDVGLILELIPYRELRRVISAEGEGRDHIETDGAVAILVEQVRRELAEPQALLHMPFGGAEAFRDLGDRGAAVDQGGMAANSSAGCIAARTVFSIKDVSTEASGCQTRHGTGWSSSMTPSAASF
jgi:hypothetical protein